MVQFIIEKNPYSTNPQKSSFPNLYGDAILKINQLNRVSLFYPYAKKTVTNLVDLNDHIILKTKNQDYKFIVERIKYTDTQLEIIGTDISLIASNKQVFDLLYQNYNMLDVLAGVRDGPVINPSSSSVIDITSSSTSDVDMTATVYGLTNTGSYKSEEIALKGTTTVTTTTTFSEIWYIKNSKVTNGILTIEDSGANVLGKLNTAGQRLANTDVVGNYGNSITYKLYSDATPNMAVKTAESFDNFNGAAESSGWTKTGSSANSASWASEGSHSMNIPASSSITKTIDFGTSNKIYQLEFDVYVNTVGTFTVDIGGSTVHTINSGAGSWQTVRIDTSGQTGSQLVELISAVGTEVYVDSIRLFNSDYIEEYADDPIPAISFNGNNGLQAINKLAQFCVVSSTDKSYDWDIRDLEDGNSWNISKPLQLYLKSQIGSSTVTDTFSNKSYSSEVMLDKDSSQIINRVTVYGGGDGVFKKFATAEDTTSQATYGIRSPETPPSYPDLNDNAELQRISDSIIQKYKDPFVRLNVDLQVEDTKANLGDTVNIIDNTLEVNENQRVVGLHYKIDGRNNESVLLEVKNLTEQLYMSEVDATRTRDALNTRRRGAVNMYMTGETQNVDNSHALDIEFYLPPDVSEINSINLNYAVEGYRTFQGILPSDVQANSDVVDAYKFNIYDDSSTPFDISFPFQVFKDLNPDQDTGLLEIQTIIRNQTGVNIGFSNFKFELYNTAVGAYVNVEDVGAGSIAAGAAVIARFTFVPSDLDVYTDASGKVTGRVTLTINSFAGSTIQNLMNLVFSASISTQPYHNHDTFPIIEDIEAQPLSTDTAGPALNDIAISIRENAGSFTDKTSELESLYGTLHISEVGPNSQTSYDLNKVYTFNADNWYTVRIQPSSTATTWFDGSVNTGATVGGIFSTLSVGTYYEFTQSTSAGFARFVVDGTDAGWTSSKQLNFSGLRYIKFDLYLSDTVANCGIESLVVSLPTFITEIGYTSLTAGQAVPKQGCYIWEIDLTSLASGTNSIVLDIQGKNNTLAALIGGASTKLTQMKGFVLEALLDGSAGATKTWRVDDIQYQGDGLSRIRGDIFTKFYLETGGTV